MSRSPSRQTNSARRIPERLPEHCVASAPRSCIAVFAAGAGACRFSGVNDGPSQSTASVATSWLLGKQLPDGGFEVAGSAGFETPDAVLAIAENAEQQYAWNATQARNAVLAAVENGNTPLQAIDDLVDGDLGFEIDAGLAAKVILLVSAPLGLSNTAFDPDGDGAANLLNILNTGAAAQRFLRDAQRDRLRGDREASRQRLRAGRHRGVHPRRATGERQLGLPRQPGRERPRHRHDRDCDPGAGGRGRCRSPTLTCAPVSCSSRTSVAPTGRGGRSVLPTRTRLRRRCSPSPPRVSIRTSRAGATRSSPARRASPTRRRSRGCVHGKPLTGTSSVNSIRPIRLR